MRSIVRMEHVPAIVHVIEVTQPQGHSTSGSHERYKTKERLEWEVEFDCITQDARLDDRAGASPPPTSSTRSRREDLQIVREAQRRAWEAYRAPDRRGREDRRSRHHRPRSATSRRGDGTSWPRNQAPFRRDAMRALSARDRREEGGAAPEIIGAGCATRRSSGDERYDAHLYSEGDDSALKVAEVAGEYADDAPVLNGFEIINACFDPRCARDPRVIVFGEDVGKLGDVNQGFAGLQAKYGELRVGDTGIRECTIIGQAIGAAMRGLRPIAEIQYLDYLLYALQILSDDLATLRWRTARRAEGAGHHPHARPSPRRHLALRLADGRRSSISLRGMYVCVPRNMTQAAGFYNTLLRADDPAIVIEVLNGYRTKEKLPANIGEFTLPLGVPEVMREGKRRHARDLRRDAAHRASRRRSCSRPSASTPRSSTSRRCCRSTSAA